VPWPWEEHWRATPCCAACDWRVSRRLWCRMWLSAPSYDANVGGVRRQQHRRARSGGLRRVTEVEHDAAAPEPQKCVSRLTVRLLIRVPALFRRLLLGSLSVPHPLRCCRLRRRRQSRRRRCCRCRCCRLCRTDNAIRDVGASALGRGLAGNSALASLNLAGVTAAPPVSGLHLRTRGTSSWCDFGCRERHRRHRHHGSQCWPQVEQRAAIAVS
jgi:hypothetical protein